MFPMIGSILRKPIKPPPEGAIAAGVGANPLAAGAPNELGALKLEAASGA